MTIFDKNSPLVVVGTPHADRKNYCLETLVNSVNAFTYPKFDFYIADNSNTRDNCKLYNKWHIRYTYINPQGKTAIQYICQSHEAIRQYAMHVNAEWLLHLEDDIIPPPNVIQQLILRRKSVIGGIYQIDFGASRHLMVQLVTHRSGLNVNVENLKSPEDAHFIDGHIKRVYSIGLGCLLIHRNVFSKIRFRYEKDKYMHPDSFFAFDCYTKNINIWADTSLILPHYNTPWTTF